MRLRDHLTDEKTNSWGINTNQVNKIMFYMRAFTNMDPDVRDIGNIYLRRMCDDFKDLIINHYTPLKRTTQVNFIKRICTNNERNLLLYWNVSLKENGWPKFSQFDKEGSKELLAKADNLKA